MRNFNDRLNDIKDMVSDTTSNLKRSLSIINEIFEKNSFDPILYGEAKSIEDKINLFETNVDEEVTKTHIDVDESEEEEEVHPIKRKGNRRK